MGMSVVLDVRKAFDDSLQRIDELIEACLTSVTGLRLNVSVA